VAIKNVDTGATVTGEFLRCLRSSNSSFPVTAADLCPTCNGDGIDLSVAAFNALGSQSQGVLNVSPPSSLLDPAHVRKQVEWHFM
jgi:expansin (peptidoglycan-binding protein)